MATKYARDQPQGFVNHVKNVVIIGAAGQVGQHITASLLKTGKHNVTAISRPDSKNAIPEGVKVVKVDYEDHAGLVNAMRGQDVLIITMNVLAPAGSVTKLINAGVEAGVPWIMPNEWGSDYTDPVVNEDTMLGKDKLADRKLIEEKGQGKSAWIALVCGFWYDYSLAGETVTFGFDFQKKTATFFDDGNFKMPYSTLPYVGEAVGKLLSLPVMPVDENDKSRAHLEEYRNGFCRVHAFRLDQRDMFASVLRVTGDKESDWRVDYKTSEAHYTQGKKLLQSGTRIGFRMMLYGRMFYPSNKIRGEEDFSDKRLGLLPLQLDEVTRWAVDEAERIRSSG